MSDFQAFSPDPIQPFLFLGECPAYAPSPLSTQQTSSDQRILIKDETRRMRLNSFKALGGTYAVARIIHAKWVAAGHIPLAPGDLLKADVRSFAKELCFVCASAGNHGLSVAAGAQIFGARARIYLSALVPEEFVRRLSDLGASVIRAGQTYEESMAAAVSDAEQTGAIHLSDGSWPGYTERPALIMEGYTVLAEELRTQINAINTRPDTVYLQAGVGGFAAAIAFMIRQNWSVQPEIVVVEPDRAACLAESAKAKRLVTARGGTSEMGRLDCKVASLLAHDALSRLNVRYMQVSDAAACAAVHELAALGFDTTPSGAAGFAALQVDNPAGTSLIVVTEGAV